MTDLETWARSLFKEHSEPALTGGNQSTAARKDVHGLTTDATQGSSLPVVARNLEATYGSSVAPTQTAGTQAPPVDTHSIANDDFKRVLVIGWIE